MADEKDQNWSQWLQAMPGLDVVGVQARGYGRIADRVLTAAAVGDGDYVLDVGTGRGLLAFAAARRVGRAGRVIGIDPDPDCVRHCRVTASQTSLGNALFLQGSAEMLPLMDHCVDVVVCRSVLCHILDKRAVFQEWSRALKASGRFGFFEPVDRYDNRFSDMVDFRPLGGIADRLREAEEAMHCSGDDSLTNFDERDLAGTLKATGFGTVEYELRDHSREYPMTASSARDWWHKDVGGIAVPGHASPYEILSRYMPAAELDVCVNHFCFQLDGVTICYRSKHLYMWGRR